MLTIQSEIHASLTNDRRNATPTPRQKKKYLKVNTIIYYHLQRQVHVQQPPTYSKR